MYICNEESTRYVLLLMYVSFGTDGYAPVIWEKNLNTNEGGKSKKMNDFIVEMVLLTGKYTSHFIGMEINIWVSYCHLYPDEPTARGKHKL